MANGLFKNENEWVMFELLYEIDIVSEMQQSLTDHFNPKTELMDYEVLVL